MSIVVTSNACQCTFSVIVYLVAVRADVLTLGNCVTDTITLSCFQHDRHEARSL